MIDVGMEGWSWSLRLEWVGGEIGVEIKVGFEVGIGVEIGVGIGDGIMGFAWD